MSDTTTTAAPAHGAPAHGAPVAGGGATAAAPCPRCAAANRPVARFCRACGDALPVDPFAGLVGVDAMVEATRALIAGAGALVRAGRPRVRLHHVLLGRPGSGKTLFARAIASACRAQGLVASPEPVRVSAVELLAEKDVHGLLARNTGRVLVIDEAHQLVGPGAGVGAGQPLLKLLAAMSRLGDETDPVVVLAGLPGPLQEHLADTPELIQRFPHRLVLPDMSAEVMRTLATRTLAAHGVTFAAGASERLLARCRHLENDSSGEYLNGYAVQRDVERLLLTIAAPRAVAGGAPVPALVLTPGDVPSPVHEPRGRDEILAELDALVGMRPVRSFIESLLTQADFAAARAARLAAAGGAAAAPRPGLDGHIMLLGNPGTGKTTVARILARIFGATGLLPTERLVEVDRGKLVSEYVGGTAKLVHQACDAAMGGVLFIDEAYDLCRDKSDTFGLEAVNTLLKRLEDDRGRFVCVVAGYSAEMADWLKSNPGLERRFPDAYRFTLPDYSDDELVEIFRRMASQRGLEIAPDAESALRVACRQLRARATKRFGNAGEVRNLVDRCERRWATRSQREGTMAPVLRAEDLAGEGEPASASAEEALAALHADLDGFVGLAEVKTALQRLADVVAFERGEQLAGRGKGTPVVHWTFGGNPGTGKTVVARLMGRFFHAMGLLPTARVVEVDAKELIGQFVGETKQKTAAVVDRAMGGVLFIDEAHQLTPPKSWGGSFNKEAVDVILKRMEDDRGKFVVIAAGYPGKLAEFLDSDPGLRSRFTRHLHFADYAPGELLEILRRDAARSGLALGPEVEARLEARCAEAIAARGDQYGNGRFARKLLDATIENQRVRLMSLQRAGTLGDADRLTILPDDVPDSALSLV